jgi:hypothetical protein
LAAAATFELEDDADNWRPSADLLLAAVAAYPIPSTEHYEQSARALRRILRQQGSRTAARYLLEVVTLLSRGEGHPALIDIPWLNDRAVEHVVRQNIEVLKNPRSWDGVPSTRGASHE